MQRRKLFILAGATVALAGCGDVGKAVISGAVDAAMPDDLKAALGDVLKIISTAEKLIGSVPDITGYVAQAKELYASASKMTSLETAKPFIKNLLGVVGTIADKLPAPYGMIALAIKTLVPVLASAIGYPLGRRAPTGLTPAQARRILTS